uniref:Uncharacterized protein n=1 Tax=Timema bartmani TaxID=61472 RepID=A0A7R9I592_9NEOP|nr:unnamed protein product [Timema bartmani]
MFGKDHTYDRQKCLGGAGSDVLMFFQGSFILLNYVSEPFKIAIQPREHTWLGASASFTKRRNAIENGVTTEKTVAVSPCNWADIADSVLVLEIVDYLPAGSCGGFRSLDGESKRHQQFRCMLQLFCTGTVEKEIVQVDYSMCALEDLPDC